MADNRYEKVKTELRQRIWREVRKNNEAITSLYFNHTQFQRVFDILVRFYTRVREAVLGIEEIWVFLIESLFQQELKGGLIFDQLHKTLFKKEIINGHRYIAALIKEIKDSMEDVNERVLAGQKDPLDDAIMMLHKVLMQLEQDLNSTYSEGMEL
jgi:hypothetical protein